MCGICGQVNFDGKQINQKHISNLMQSIANRGKDSYGTYEKNNIFLGHHRLSVIDTSAMSNQPMEFEDMVLVFNGVIYNYKSLKEKLISLGHYFKTTGDTEVVLRAYIEFGEKCVEEFDGVFALCIYEKESKKVFLARDRLGIKPLYYMFDGSCFSFSSSMLGLIKNKTNININPKALHFQFTLHSVVPAPDTIIESINKLEPGFTLSISSKGKKSYRKYFDINIITTKTYSDEEIVNSSKYLLNKAIEKRILISDVPVGVLLSGGLDSSIITAMAKTINTSVNTYSIGFDTINEEIGDEFKYSDKVSDIFKTKHHKYYMTDSDLFSSLDTVIANMSEPMFSQDSSAFNLLAKNVSQNHKVVLSGQGADEVFGGYFWYKKIYENNDENDTEVFSKYYFDRTHHKYKEAINKQYIFDNYTYNSINDIFDDMNPELSLLDKVFRLELSMLIIDDPVKRIDSMTMAHSLETRVPFLDIDLISYMLSVKGEAKIKNDSKYYLKKLSKEYLPDDIIYRKKFYFPVPPLKILKNEFYRYCKNILTSERAINRKIYNQKYINELINNPNKYYTNLNGNELWHFTLLERWLQLNIEH